MINAVGIVTEMTKGVMVTLEPISGQLVIAKAAFQAGTAAIQLSDTVIGRIKLRRMIQNAEKQEIQRWLQERLSALRIEGELRLSSVAQDAIADIWEKHCRMVARNPDAERYHLAMTEQALWRIMRAAGSV